ncbi:MAG: hypothetical protein D6739_09980, partial [Nitrospirae bacterium]
LQAVLEREPTCALARANLGGLLTNRGRLAAALEHLEAALATDPESPQVHANLFMCLVRRGDHERGLGHAWRAQELEPEDTALHGDLLGPLAYVEAVSPAELAARATRWGDRVAAAAEPVARPAWDGARDRPLRVGYLSPDLKSHSVAFFLEPILEAHDPAAVEVFCYSNTLRTDAVTERLRGHARGWRDITRLTDGEAAARIAADRIDLLVDLAGVTAGNRLRLLAYRPAPVQATYLGFDATTGIAAVDFRITDPWLDPEGFEAHYRERLWRLPLGYHCYRPPEAAPPVTPPPSLDRGRITFGSFNNLAKVGPGVVRAWAELLHRVPGSRLLLKHAYLSEEATRAWVARRFTDCGVEPGRLELLGHVDGPEDHLALYGEVDIALDPFPYGGCTTTCEALWMGVPVVTLAADRAMGRYGVSILSRLGLADWIAGDRDAYLALAAARAADLEGLAALRYELRSRVAASSLCQAAPFTRALEAAYRAMAERLWAEGRR